jgi:Domain of unknown function (DUF3576)
MVQRLWPLICVVLLVVGLAGCNRTTPVPSTDYNTQINRGNGTSLTGTGGLLFSTGHSANASQDPGGALGVNAYLWRAALDTLSFMPLASADPFGGVIITDWYTSPAAPSERFKATAYILGRQLRADGVRVSIFRQTLQNGQWLDAPVAGSTTGDIENKILARARELRTQSASQ